MNDNRAPRSNETLNIANVLQGFNLLPNTAPNSVRFPAGGGFPAVLAEGSSQGNGSHADIISN
jgi:hypothetical protein